MDELEDLSKKLGRLKGATALYKEARKAGIDVTKKGVKDFVEGISQKQVQPAPGGEDMPRGHQILKWAETPPKPGLWERTSRYWNRLRPLALATIRHTSAQAQKVQRTTVPQTRDIACDRWR